MPSHIARHNNGVSRPGVSPRWRRAIHDLAHAGGGNKHSVHLTFTRHLGVAGHQRYAGFRRGGRHGVGNSFKLVQLKALLDHKGAGEVTWPCAHAGKVVYRAAHAQLADVPSRKKRRRDDKPIRRHGDAPRRPLQHRRVVGRKQRAREPLCKNFVDKLRRLLPTGPHGQGNLFAHS